MRHIIPIILCAMLVPASWAATKAPPLLGSGLSLGQPLQVVLLLTLLTFLPAVFMSVTPFLRITVVLHFLRQAVGTQSTPSNQVLIGLALFLTILIMNPVFSQVYEKGWVPLENGQVGYQVAWEQGSKPMHDFLLRFSRENDIRLLLEITKAPARKSSGHRNDCSDSGIRTG